MSNDVQDLEWRCGCSHTNPDYDERCNRCGQERYSAETMASLNRGLKELGEGKAVSLGSFAAYADDEDEVESKL